MTCPVVLDAVGCTTHVVCLYITFMLRLLLIEELEKKNMFAGLKIKREFKPAYEDLENSERKSLFE